MPIIHLDPLNHDFAIQYFLLFRNTRYNSLYQHLSGKHFQLPLSNLAQSLTFKLSPFNDLSNRSSRYLHRTMVIG